MYWPKCREDDRVAGREVRRQRAWSRALAVSCPVHGEPLTIDHFDRRNWGGFGEASPLSENEREVLALISQGLSNKLIAAALTTTESTVKAHVKSIIRRLNVANRTQAALLAAHAGTASAGLPRALASIDAVAA